MDTALVNLAALDTSLVATNPMRPSHIWDVSRGLFVTFHHDMFCHILSNCQSVMMMMMLAGASAVVAPRAGEAAGEISSDLYRT